MLQEMQLEILQKNPPPNTTAFNVTSFFFHRIGVHLLLKCCNKGKDITCYFYALQVALSFRVRNLSLFPSPEVHFAQNVWKGITFSCQVDVMYHLLFTIGRLDIRELLLLVLLSFSLFLTSW